MAAVTAPDNAVYDDSVYSGICTREKALREFDGIVSLTEASRIVASGACSQCGTTITLSLYTP